jgi:hypothetical protein
LKKNFDSGCIYIQDYTSLLDKYKTFLPFTS